MASFSERLKELRIENRLTQEELATKFFLNKSSVSRYERGQQVPELELLQKIANFFLVSIDYLLGKSDTRTYKIQDDLPEELKNLGVEYLTVTKEAKDKGLSPEDLRKIIDAVTAIKKSNNNN